MPRGSINVTWAFDGCEAFRIDSSWWQQSKSANRLQWNESTVEMSSIKPRRWMSIGGVSIDGMSIEMWIDFLAGFLWLPFGPSKRKRRTSKRFLLFRNQFTAPPPPPPAPPAPPPDVEVVHNQRWRCSPFLGAANEEKIIREETSLLHLFARFVFGSATAAAALPNHFNSIHQMSAIHSPSTISQLVPLIQMVKNCPLRQSLAQSHPMNISKKNKETFQLVMHRLNSSFTAIRIKNWPFVSDRKRPFSSRKSITIDSMTSPMRTRRWKSNKISQLLPKPMEIQSNNQIQTCQGRKTSWKLS